LAREANAERVAFQVLGQDELVERAPALAKGQLAHGLLLFDGGVLDLHMLISTLASRARGAGATLRTAAEVAHIERTPDGERVNAVHLSSGERISASRVVIAAGAWSAGLGRSLGLDLPLTPLRRHLVQLRSVGDLVVETQPVVWRLEDEVYFRSESRGVLASPCDETVWQAETPPNDPAALDMLAQKLERTAPQLAQAQVQRAWACLRTFAPDRELVIGADPRTRGLHWLCGLGGRGMSVAPAAAELLTQDILGIKANAGITVDEPEAGNSAKPQTTRFAVARLLKPEVG
jgi:D-arginine dehydrogenase